MDMIKQLYQLSKDLDVLFVEDDDELRSQMSGMFSELFHKVDTGENGRVGLQKYSDRLDEMHKPYDLVITDINMPEMNGIEMIHAVYKLNPLQPIVVVSAHNESDYLMELLHVGINSFLIKPVRHQELITTLYKVTKAIINEGLVEKHYQEIERLNAKLSAQSEALQKSNDEMHEKNIALEKSMRIIEGMQHKDQIHRQISIPTKSTKTGTAQEKKDKAPSHLKNIENLINDIAMRLPHKCIEDSALQRLSDAINDYASSLPDEQVHQNLQTELKQLSSTLSTHPKCNSVEELERIFSMLESFFFIYAKWEQEWENIDRDKFEVFSSSIENEINTLIDVWNCKI